MVKSQGSDFFLSVPIEASVFLAAVSAFAVFLLVVFMYVNKKWRLLDVSIGEEIKASPPPQQPYPIQDPATATNTIKPPRNPSGDLNYDDYCTVSPLQSTLYSDESLTTRARHPNTIFSTRPTLLSTSMRGYSLDQTSSSSSPNHSSQFKRMHVQHRSLDLGGPVSSEFERYSPDFSRQQQRQQMLRQQSQHAHAHAHAQAQQQQQQHLIVTNGEVPVDTGRSAHFTGSMSLRPLRVTMIRDVDGGGGRSDGGGANGAAASRRRPRHQKGMTRSSTSGGRSDIMSLAEKGKVCGGSSASSTSSNVSADDVDLHGHHRSHHISGPNGSIIHCQLSPSKSAPLSMGSQLNSARLSRHSKIPRNSGDLRPHPLTIPSNVTSSSSGGISSHSNFRRLVKQPRTNSMDSETPPTSEAGTSTYADEDGHIFEDDEMSTVDGTEAGRSMGVTTRNQYGRWDVAFDSEDSDVKMTPRSLQALGVLSKEIGAVNSAQVRILLLPRGNQRPRSKLTRGESCSGTLENFGNKVTSNGLAGSERRTTPTTRRYIGNGSCAEDGDGYAPGPVLQTSL